MKLRANRYYFWLLFLLLALLSVTIFAHRMMPSSGGDHSSIALPTTKTAARGGNAARDKQPGQPNSRSGTIGTITSAASLTNGIFFPKEATATITAPEPVQAGGSFNIAQSVIA